jgi:hypothetical protein
MCLFATALIMISCSKEKTATEPTNHEAQMSAADRDAMQRVVQFRHKVAYKKANPNFKSGEIVAIDSARWDVETNFNATYAFPDEHYLATRHDSAVLFLPVLDDSTTLMDDVLAFNDQCFSQVLALYNSSPFTNKELLFVSLKKGEMAKGELEVKLKVVTGEKQTTTYTWEPFGDGDEWMYGDHFGKCDGSYFNESDAAEQIEVWINNHKPLDMPEPNCRFIYVRDEENPYKLMGNEFENNSGEYLIFYMESETDFGDEDKCLSVDEMNFHTNGEGEVVYELMRVIWMKPGNWKFMNCDLVGLYEQPNLSCNFYKLRHENYLDYGYRYLVLIEEIGNAQSLSLE